VPQGRCGQAQKISPPPGFDPRTVQPADIRYTDCTTLPMECICMHVNKDVIILQVAVQATPCVDWELHAPANGALNCLPGEKGLQCIATCSPGFR